MEATTNWNEAQATKRAEGHSSLDDRAAMSGAELGELYATGTTPEDMRVLQGRPKGRMLAVRGADRESVFEGLRRFAGSRSFPWGGKSFFAIDAAHGRGVNRVRLAKS